ncbi:Phosphoserine phosphatase [invertebrate metagenome]|uniref:phosphoserine phosphatase n=1 Tax=invertebrate metagenome TaxID=1711999 RepID=A0A2H9T713_9ZZZZ
MSHLLQLHIKAPEDSHVLSSVLTLIGQYAMDIVDTACTVHDGNTVLMLLVASPQPVPTDFDDVLRNCCQHQVDGHACYGVPVLGSVSGKNMDIRMTLLSKDFSAEGLAYLTECVSGHDFSIRHMAPVEIGVSTSSLAGFDWDIAGAAKNYSALKQQVMDIGLKYGIDLSVQILNTPSNHEDINRDVLPSCQLAVFDMDSTLIKAEVIDELARFAGVGDRVADITRRCVAGELDFKASFRERIALLKGLDESVIDTIAHSLPLMKGAEQVFSVFKQQHIKTVLISGGFIPFARVVQKKLGIDAIYTNALECENGKVTGKTKGTIVDAQEKARLMKQLAGYYRISLDQVVAIGDGANDIPMLTTAGLGVAFQASSVVRESADAMISSCGLEGILLLPPFRKNVIQSH